MGRPLIRALVLPGDVALSDVIDARVLAFTSVVSILMGVLCGVVPALQASRPDLTKALKAGPGEGTHQRSLTRSALLVGKLR
ncbi:MAG: hypothetical protein WKF84_09570 [Pyrinomonadaceae bacterium]